MRVSGLGLFVGMVLFAGSVSSVQAAPLTVGQSASVFGNAGSSIQLIAEKKKRYSRVNKTKKFKARRGGVKDTCPGGDQKCIDDLIAACDKAGGGLSTEPDGGVDCQVDGIHF